MHFNEDVENILNTHRSIMVYIFEAKICRFKGMKYHSSVYDTGKYKMTITTRSNCKNYEKQYNEFLETKCHPYCKMGLVKVNYKLTKNVQVTFRDEKERDAASKKLQCMQIVKNVYLHPFKDFEQVELTTSDLGECSHIETDVGD